MMCAGEGPCYDPWRQIEAAPDGGVVAFRDEIDLPVLEMPFGSDARITCQKSRQQGQDVGHAEGGRHADPEHAGRFPTITGNARDRGLNSLQIVGDGQPERFSCFGQGQLTRRAVEQPHAEIALQHGNVPTDRSRCQRQPPGCFGEAAMLRALHESFEVGEGFQDASSIDR